MEGLREACDSCHRRKTRCISRGHGACASCWDSGQVCIYSPKNPMGRPSRQQRKINKPQSHKGRPGKSLGDSDAQQEPGKSMPSTTTTTATTETTATAATVAQPESAGAEVERSLRDEYLAITKNTPEIEENTFPFTADSEALSRTMDAMGACVQATPSSSGVVDIGTNINIYMADMYVVCKYR